MIIGKEKRKKPLLLQEDFTKMLGLNDQIFKNMLRINP